MTDASSENRWWWETAALGERIPLAFVKLDRVGSTGEWEELPEEAVLERRARYTAGIESVARKMDAAQPLHFQGDGVMLFLTDDAAEPAAVRAFLTARALWERMWIDLSLPVRIAVHAAEVPWNLDTGQLAHPAIDVCGHLEQVTPGNSIAVTERVFLALPEHFRRQSATLGLTARDRTPAYVFPANAAERKDPAAFQPDDDLATWAAFRAYAQSPEIRRLRYVGFRLARKEPPSLDIRDVFVPLEVRVRRRGSAVAAELEEAPAIRNPAIRNPAASAPPGAPWERFERQPAAPIRPFREVFAERRSAVVLGDPGAGKTTLLRWLAVMAAAGPDAMVRELGVAERLLPLPVSLGRLTEVRSVGDGIGSVAATLARYFHDRNVGEAEHLKAFLERQLEAGVCLLLLDGLDEVAVEQRAGLRGWLEAFASRYPRNRFVVTSRIVGFGGFVLPDAVEVVVQPLDDGRVKRYVETFHREYRRWETGVDDPVAAAREARVMLDAIAGSARLREVARNPFLVSALALIHRAEGRLPHHRLQVYEIFARALCETWGNARRLVAGEATFDIAFEEEALPLLGHLALRMHEAWPAGVAPEEFVVDTLAVALVEHKGGSPEAATQTARAFLERAGEEVQILLERGAGRWGFLHLTFQEFFTAAGLHAAEEFEAVAFEHLFEPRWQEVLRLGVGYYALVQKRPRAARRFVEKVFHHRIEGRYSWITDVVKMQVPLAALLAAEAGDALPGDLQDTLAREFAAWYSDMPPEIGAPILHELKLTEFHKRLEEPLRVRLANGDIEKQTVSCEIPENNHRLLGRQVSEISSSIDRKDSQPILNALDDNSHWWVRSLAARALAGLQDHATVDALLAKRNDKHFEVRLDVLLALWNIAEAHPWMGTSPKGQHA